VDEIKEINFNETGDIIDTLSGISLKDTPEERVRQRFIGILQTDYGYPKANIAREVPVQQGSKILLSTDEAEIRADIVVYANKKACLERDQGNILFVVECKKPTVTEGYTQLVSYIYNTSAIGGVWTNGEGMYVYKKRNGGEIGLDEILTLPRYREGWSGGDSIPIQPRHIQEMLIPVPSDWNYAKNIIDAGNEFIHAMECMSVADKMVREDGLDAMLKNEVAE